MDITLENLIQMLKLRSKSFSGISTDTWKVTLTGAQASAPKYSNLF